MSQRCLCPPSGRRPGARPQAHAHAQNALGGAAALRGTAAHLRRWPAQDAESPRLHWRAFPPARVAELSEALYLQRQPWISRSGADGLACTIDTATHPPFGLGTPPAPRSFRVSTTLWPLVLRASARDRPRRSLQLLPWPG